MSQPASGPTEPSAEPCVLHVECERPTDVALISFAGIAARFAGMPAFEFAQLTASLPAHRTYVRDPSPFWYHAGVEGAGKDAVEVAATLRAWCDRRGVRRIVTIGNSSGGYSAILFGVLLGADEVQSIVPKTRLLHATEFRDPSRFETFRRAVDVPDEFLDLRRLILARAPRVPQVHVHYGSGERLDTQQARHLDGLPGVHLHAYPWDDHDIVKPLRDEGVLAEILADAVAGRTGDGRRVARRGARRLRWRRFRSMFRRDAAR